MISYIIRRVLLIFPTVFVALSLLFLLFFTLPGDPARLIAGGSNRSVPQEVVDRATERYGLDDPLWEQYATYWRHTLTWDLGESYVEDGTSVNETLGEKAPNSIRLAIWALIIEVIVGIAVGLISAIRRYSLLDRFTTLATAGAAAVPAFVMGFVLQYVFSPA
jgi:ABC-type dipeptide/oligopeptide/nickel transport system permease component